ncbi:MAG: hypothetical protein KKG00_00050, partial [Bacteroidetes bacterium]|nr:hypothetical protein [Bacteroidota bacterium]
MKTSTKTPLSLALRSHRPGRTIGRLIAFLLALYGGLIPGYAQPYPQEVKNISTPNHRQTVEVQTWTVPSGGPYKLRITAKGARGGRGHNNGHNPGGAGATIVGEFFVSSGQVLELTAGAPGGESPYFGAGGGGSSVKIKDGALLLVAGGGGGGGNYSRGGNGSGGTSGPIGIFSISGGGGSSGILSRGGAGSATTGGSAGTQGSTGGGGAGGGGGGGGGSGSNGGSAGGGGGYSGGNGGCCNGPGTGGGSYNTGSNQSNTAGDNNAGGQVIIENLGPVTLMASAMVVPTQPTCASPTQGSVTIDLEGDFDGNTTSLEYAIVAGDQFSGNPTFTDLTADPLVVSSGLGTAADIDSETYTVRIRLKYNADLFTVDNTYTLTGLPVPTLTLGMIPPICAGATSFTIPYTASSQSPTTYSVSGAGVSSATDADLPGSPITVNLSAPATGSGVDFTLTVKNAAGCVSEEIKGSVTVDPASAGGTLNGSLTVCTGSGVTLAYLLAHQAQPGFLVLSDFTGSVVRWESSVDEGFTHPVDLGNANRLSVENLTQTTYFRAVVQSGVCGEAYSSVATVTVDPASVGGTVSGSATVCAGSNSTTLRLDDEVGSVQKWQSSLDGSSSSWTDIPSSAEDTYTATNLTQT